MPRFCSWEVWTLLPVLSAWTLRRVPGVELRNVAFRILCRWPLGVTVLIYVLF